MDNNGKYPIKSLGDGLFIQGGSLYCKLPIVSISEPVEEGTTGSVTFEFEPYSITVTYDIVGNKRANPRWVRVYKAVET